MTVLVSAPGDLVVATSDGVDVRFGGVRLDVTFPPSPVHPVGTRGVRVDVAGVRGPATQVRDTRFEEARLAWADRLRAEGRESAGDAPAMPGALVLSRVTAQLSDDVGTEYRFAAGVVAGDGTAWEGSWFHVPVPPASARTLSVCFLLDGEPTGQVCELRLR